MKSAADQPQVHAFRRRTLDGSQAPPDVLREPVACESGLQERIVLRAEGMHCAGCERIIETSLRALAPVLHAKADYARGLVTVDFDPQTIEVADLCAAVARNGYRCAPATQPAARMRPLPRIRGMLFGALGIAALILLDTQVISAQGVPDVSRHLSYPLLFLLGLLTGFHCIGMCGGIVLSYTAAAARQGHSAYSAHAVYGLGKVLSYTGFGALFGLIGAAVTFTPLLRGVAGIGAGAFLIAFGLNILGVFAPLRKVRIAIPAGIVRMLGQHTRNQRRPFVLGLLTGLMIACGPLQAMYVMAAGTGSPLEGAKMLFVFGVGTLPVLTTFGFLTSVISGRLTRRLLQASGAILIVLGAVMINRGLILTGTGWDLGSFFATLRSGRDAGTSQREERHPGAQTIVMVADRAGYTPNVFSLRAGIPVRWIIRGNEITSCNRRIVVPSLKLEFDVRAGEQVVEFTPPAVGTIPWSCWMGMLHGRFDVIAAADGAEPAAAGQPLKIIPPPATPSPNVPAPVPQTYAVLPGDTLSGIAVKQYGSARRWTDMAAANPGIDPRRLRPGQILVLPAALH